jgi:zinc transporter, ZIP family
MDLLYLSLAATATVLATGLGTIPVFLLGARAESLRPLLWGATVGSMTVASFVGLILPALDEGSTLEVAAGIAAGAAFLVVSRAALARTGRTHPDRAPGVRTSILVFGVLFVHSLPEGLAIGTAYASDRAGLSLFVIVAIAIHNVPEGTTIAIPMSIAGYSRSRQFWAAVGTSVPQLPGALVAYLLVEAAEQALPASFGFAAGAMLALVALELVPSAFGSGRRGSAAAGVAAGAGVMFALAALLTP